MIKNCNQCKKDFSTKDKRQKYCSKDCYHQYNSGANNHFFHYRNSAEKIKKINSINSDKFKGQGNPFYGKTHSKETIEKIKLKSIEHRTRNRDIIEKSLLERLNLSPDKLKTIYEEYAQTHETLATLQEKYNVDKRVLKKYILKYVCSKQELDKCTFNKKYKNATSIGEEKLFLLLCNTFGSEKIKRQFNLSYYYYDFLIDSKLIVEYDGYYWHVLMENNDSIKNELAKNNNLQIYRVKEDEKRKVDFLKEIEIIKRIYNEI